MLKVHVTVPPLSVLVQLSLIFLAFYASRISLCKTKIKYSLLFKVWNRDLKHVTMDIYGLFFSVMSCHGSECWQWWSAEEGSTLNCSTRSVCMGHICVKSVFVSVQVYFWQVNKISLHVYKQKCLSDSLFLCPHLVIKCTRNWRKMTTSDQMSCCFLSVVPRQMCEEVGQIGQEGGKRRILYCMKMRFEPIV